MKYLLFNIALALNWAALTGRFEPANLMIGFGLGYLVLLVAHRALGPSTYFRKVPQALGFAAYFLWVLILANVRLAADVLTPRHRMQPRVIALPLEARTDYEITMLANLISLTPGSLSLDVAADRRMLFIHVMYAADVEATQRKIIDELERRLLALMR